MTARDTLQGVMAPLLSPFNVDFSFNTALYVAHAHWLLQQGVHQLTPFGTTGEALSVSIAGRMRATEALVDGGVAATRLMPGVGLCNLAESVTLARHAVQLGCAAVMVLPPFFYRHAADEGLYRYFANLVEVIAEPSIQICLYHIPPLAGVGFSPALTARLVRDFPANIVAYKDSSGDFAHTEAIRAAAPDLAVFPGSEVFLVAGLAAGCAGCISATANVNAAALRAVYDCVRTGADGGVAAVRMHEFRRIIEKNALIPAMKGLLADARDHRWRQVRPPLLPATTSQTADLYTALGRQLPELAATAV